VDVLKTEVKAFLTLMIPYYFASDTIRTECTLAVATMSVVSARVSYESIKLESIMSIQQKRGCRNDDKQNTS